MGIDPSGDFTKGKGTTGMCLLDTHSQQVLDVFDVSAKDFDRIEAYWTAITDIIMNYRALYKGKLAVAMEDYILYADKAQSQINSLLETPRIIGVIQWLCYKYKIPYATECAGAVKQRWANHILAYKGYITLQGKQVLVQGKPQSDHCVDAIRHAVHYATFKNNKGVKKTK